MKHILIVDDDIPIGAMLEEALEREGYQVSRAGSGEEALRVLARTGADLVLLDLMLPGVSGEQVLSRLRDIPVIVLSAKADPEHKADLLLGGAADYVTKPFSLRELLARVALRLGESPAASGGVLRWGALTLNCDTRTACFGDSQTRLTRTEYAILTLLMAHPAQVITKSRLLERLAQDTPDCTESSLKTHMSNLRRKLREIGAGDCVEAVWGIGFKMRTTECKLQNE